MSPTLSCPKRRVGWRRKTSGLLLGLWGACCSSSAQARDLWGSDDGERSVSLRSALKSVVLVASPPGEQAPTAASHFWRGRMTLDAYVTEWLSVTGAYEQQILSSNGGAVATAGLLPSTRGLPYQVHPWGSALVDEPSLQWRQAVDRAAVTIRGQWGRATLGRQAIGLGRASFFTAVDLLAPFGAFQVDQEWKSGVDALDVEWQLSDSWSLGFTEAIEERFTSGAALVRSVYNWGDADVLVIGGRRSEDWMVGAASSWALFDAAFFAEAAAFVADADGVASPQFGSHGVVKAVTGGSYSVDVLAGLLVSGEYHFNGFGLRDVQRQQRLLLDPGYQRRLARGDFQTLGQQQLAVSSSLGFNDSVRAYGYTVISLQDGTGLVALGATHDGQAFSLDVSGYVPWGSQRGAPLLGSEYGSTPASLYVGMRFYD